MSSVLSVSSVIPTAHNLTAVEEKSAKYWTDVKIKRVVYYALAAIAVIGAAAIVAASLIGGMPVLSLLSIFPLIAAGGFIYLASQLKDYENPKELAKMQTEALPMNFRELYREHGIKNLRRYFDTALPLPELQRRFHLQIQTMDFREILRTFRLDDLTEITTPNHIAFLRSLEAQASRLDGEFAYQKQQAGYRHPNRTELMQQRIHAVKHQIDATTTVVNGGDFRNRLDTYAKTSAITTPLAFAGSLIAESACASEQQAYDNEVALARGTWLFGMQSLERQYTGFKSNLI